MSTEKRYTERDMVMAKREAFVEGAQWRFNSRHYKPMPAGSYAAAAQTFYPLPKVTRPRVMYDQDGYAYRVVDGVLQWRVGENREWRAEDTVCVRTGDVHRLAELFVNPTEEVEETE